VNSNDCSDRGPLDLDRDLPTTAEDVRVLRELRRQTPGWFDLAPEEIEALLPEHVLDLRPPTPPHRRPFSLE
jgi:hypothetical protein